MTSLRAHVENGRLVLDEPTTPPEGTVVDLVADDEGDDLLLSQIRVASEVVGVLLAGSSSLKLIWTIIATVSLMAFAASAHAQGVGVRAGASTDPDQFYAGVHVETGELVERLRFRPNVEVGVGDNVTLVALNFEFTYRLPPTAPRLPRALSMWHLYVGAGPALNIFKFKNDTRSEGGFNGLIGLAHSNGLFAEAKLGALKSPNFKFGVGYTFH